MWLAARRCSLVTGLAAGIMYTCLMCSAFLAETTLAKTISGRVEKCSNDGERVSVPILGKDSCYKCFCKKGRVECESHKCPSLEGCHAILFTRPKGHCCNVCKGCLVGESYLASGDVWSSTDDNCVINICQAGVVTSSREVCRPPCQQPGHVPGQCCPSCPGCYHDGLEHLEGEIFTLKQNPGVQCVCKQGNTTCSKRLCPVLNCPEDKIYFDRGDKCPRCTGQRMVFDTPRSCFFAKRVFVSGERHSLDNCTSCICVQGTMICDRLQCPELACPPIDQFIVAGMCCPACKRKLFCPVGNMTMKHEETWQPDKCTTCTCRDGAVRCAPKWCTQTSICPDGYRLRYKEHHCCPVCTRNDGVCTLRGPTSDVIDTFDGRTYNLHGFCTHDLIRDCTHGQLTVKVKYKTKAGVQKHIDIVTIRFGSTSIKLYKSSEIRINRTNLFSNHFNSNNFSLKIQPSQIIVKVKAGLNLNWNLNDRLAIKVSGSYFKAGSLCGLCGDFDGDGSNDLVNKKGNQVEDSDLMAFTWVRGKICRKHLLETYRGSTVGEKHPFLRYPYQKRRLAIKYGHQQQMDLLDRSHAGPSKKSNVFEGGRLYHHLNDTGGTILNDTTFFVNDSSASENKNSALKANSSENNVDTAETNIPFDVERECVNNVTEKIVVAEFNISGEEKTKSPNTCQPDTSEFLKSMEDCQKIREMKLDSCGSGFSEADFVRSCTDVICACLNDQLCKDAAVSLFLQRCRGEHNVTLIPPP